MVTKTGTVVSIRTGNEAIAKQLSSVSRRNSKGHFTAALAWGLVGLAFAWGLYESVQLLTGVIPKF
jgi:hypothetical protein